MRGRTAAALLLAPLCGAAQEAPNAADADHLAKQLSNPVAALISVPLQLNYDEGYGAGGDGERFTLNIQPVAPFSISKDWNVISRTILPVIHQDDVIGDESQSGIGDVTKSRRVTRASQRARRAERAMRALSVAMPVLAYIWR